MEREEILLVQWLAPVGDQLCLNSRVNQVARLLHLRGYPPMCVCECFCQNTVSPCLQEIWPRSFCAPCAWSLTCFVFQTNDAVGFLFNWVFFVPLIGKIPTDWVCRLTCLISQSLDLSSCSTSCSGSWASESDVALSSPRVSRGSQIVQRV